MKTPGVSARRWFGKNPAAIAVAAAVILSMPGQMKAGETGGSSRGRLGQISTRGLMDGKSGLIAGFIITGAQAKKVIVRVLGPSLGLSNAVKDPYLAMYGNPEGDEGYNDDWPDDQPGEIAASTIPPPEPEESAVVTSFVAGGSGHTAVGYTEHEPLGVGLVEVYDLDLGADSELANISTRGLVEKDDNALIAGFTVLGDEPLRVIVRAIGPTMQKNLVYEKALADPTLELRDRNGLLLASNDNWRSDQEPEINATTIPPEDERESAIVHTLSQGPYTAIVRGANGVTGLGLVEVYALH